MRLKIIVISMGLLWFLSACGGNPTPLPTTTFQVTDGVTSAPLGTPQPFTTSESMNTPSSPGENQAVSGTLDNKAVLATAKAEGQIQSPGVNPEFTPGPTATPLPFLPLPEPALQSISSLARPADPVVMTGADIPAFLGIPPNDLVAWRWDGTLWQQIPIQVDERNIIDLRVVNGRHDASAPVFLFYADPAVNPDIDPMLDSDDEIVFMARDAGLSLTETSSPPGVISSTGLEVTITDPLDNTAVGYIYLFRQDGSLDPGAGQQYVAYHYAPIDSGNDSATKQDNQQSTGPINEDSIVVSPYYGQHFSARWIVDRLNLFPTNSGNLIDRFRSQLRPGDCDRSENTFSAGTGFFVAQKSGPVRAIRSYMGANSGVYTQRLHIFYDQREDVITYVRVHALPGLMDFVDYSQNAIGMTYFNNLNPDGVTIDGQADEMADGTLTWELVSGSQGSLVMLHQVETTIPDLDVAAYYEDEAEPATRPCTGDAQALGNSGLFLSPLPCTDPARAAVDPDQCAVPYLLILNRTIYLGPPNATAEEAEAQYQQWQNPLQYQPWPSG